MKPKDQICTNICQFLVVCGYVIMFLILLPFLLILTPIALIAWAMDKVTECANKTYKKV